MIQACCPVCSRRVSNAAHACPGCGHPSPDGGWPRPGGFFWKAVVGIIVLMIMVNILTIEDGSQRRAADIDLDSVRVMKLVDGQFVAVNPGKRQVPEAAVVNSAWDGSVWQVERYLDRTLKDPDSFEAIDWGKVMPTDGGYAVLLRYRAKNSLGGYVIEQRLFALDHDGNVISGFSRFGDPFSEQ